MKYQLRIFPAADSDVDQAAAYIAEDDLDAALRFYDAVDQTYQIIQEHPNRWSRYELDHPQLKNLHKRSVKGFASYLIFYRIEGEIVEVIRILHGMRDLPAILAQELFQKPEGE